jgi:hypothetical protein
MSVVRKKELPCILRWHNITTRLKAKTAVLVLTVESGTKFSDITRFGMCVIQRLCIYGHSCNEADLWGCSLGCDSVGDERV